jgi:signal transduction histidine kinase
MKQVLDHLLSNAVKFTGEGGTVSVIAAPAAHGGLVVIIRDTGCGIPAEYLDRVLEPFGQVEDHLTRQTDGVGLGLPLARAMTGMHGGDLTLTSEVGVGTIVHVSLPAARLRATPTEYLR